MTPQPHATPQREPDGYCDLCGDHLTFAEPLSFEARESTGLSACVMCIEAMLPIPRDPQ
jgi:hypothetical protein